MKRWSTLIIAIAAVTLVTFISGSVLRDPRVAERASDATWVYNFDSIDAMVKEVTLVVVGEVIGTSLGRIVDPADAEPHQFTEVNVRVLETWKGDLAKGDIVVIEQSSGGDTPFMDARPQYEAGSKHVLYLKWRSEPAFPTRYFVISPQGRYELVDGKLQSVSASLGYRLNTKIDGESLGDARASVASARIR